MEEWYYAVSGNREGPVSQEQLLELSRSGSILGDTLVWKDGMPEWTRFDQCDFSGEMARCAVTGEVHPKADLLPYGDKWVLPQHKDHFVQGLQEGAAPLHEGIAMEWQGFQYKDPTKREKIAKGGILFSSISMFLWVVGCAIYGGYLGATDQMDKFDEGQIVILGLLIIMPTFLVGNICYVMWIHTVVKNAHIIERRELDQTPGWAVAFHFIPIALLFKPYIAVKQVWNASQRQNLQTGSKLLGWWWGSWLGYSLLTNWIPAIGFPSGAAACVLGWIFITRISRWQRELGGFTS